MAGGLFPNYPFELNPKCIIFSIIIIGLFFYEPPNMNIYWKSFVSLILFVLSYVSMAWYDYKFDCQKLALKKSASTGITGQFKPPAHTPSQTDRSKLTKDENELEWLLINLYHLLILSPLFLYVSVNKDSSNQASVMLLLVNFIFAIIYHGVRLARNFNVVSFGHILVSLIGIYYSLKSSRPEWFYNGLMGASIYTGLKHGLHIMKSSH